MDSIPDERGGGQIAGNEMAPCMVGGLNGAVRYPRTLLISRRILARMARG